MNISKEIKIALAAIIAIAIIYLGIIFLKGVRLTKSSNTYFVEMNDVNGLAESAPVLANGVQIGIVNDVTFVTEKQNVLLAIELNKGVRIPNGSKAALTKEMLGAAKLKINLGNAANGFMAVNDTIKGTPTNDLLSAAGEIMPDLESVIGKIDSLLYNVNLLLTNPTITNSLYNVQTLTQNIERSSAGLPDVLGNVNNIAGNLNHVSAHLAGQAESIMSDAKTTMDNIQNASQSVNSLCADMQQQLPTLLNSANQIGANLVQTTDKINQEQVEKIISNLGTSVQNLTDVTANLSSMMNNQESTLGKILYDPDVYNKLDSTLANASRLLEDLKAHPKRYVHFSLFGKKDK